MDLIPHDLEYKKRNRYLVHFPKNFGISPLQIESTTLPAYESNNVTIMGINVASRLEVTDVTVIVREIEGFSVMKNLINIMDIKQFDFTIELVNGQNVVMDKWIMSNCFISQVSTSTLSYESDEILTTTLTIKPNKLTIL
jgi:hypothetical protein